MSEGQSYQVKNIGREYGDKCRRPGELSILFTFKLLMKPASSRATGERGIVMSIGIPGRDVLCHPAAKLLSDTSMNGAPHEIENY